MLKINKKTQEELEKIAVQECTALGRRMGQLYMANKDNVRGMLFEALAFGPDTLQKHVGTLTGDDVEGCFVFGFNEATGVKNETLAHDDPKVLALLACSRRKKS